MQMLHTDVSRDMPYSADMLLENVLDSSHVPFTHHQTISKRENAVPLPIKLTSAVAASGFAGEISMALPGSDPQESAPDWQGRATERTSVFRAPAYMHHRIRFLYVLLCVCPACSVKNASVESVHARTHARTHARHACGFTIVCMHA